MEKGFIIAIDGPVASGKGTIAPKLAQRLGGFHLYTGGTYRAIALYCLRNNIKLDDIKTIEKILHEIKIDLNEEGIFLNGENVTTELNQPQVANASSSISIYKTVREAMVSLQQIIASREVEKGKIVIAEGRDTATKVFPNAKFKLFLTAVPEVRARRRLNQYSEKGITEHFENVLKDTIIRDKRDSEREVDPLVKDPEKFGYRIIDNSNQTQEETIDIILNELNKSGVNL